jgi:gliding motility-associated lipoprotein GldH
MAGTVVKGIGLLVIFFLFSCDREEIIQSEFRNLQDAEWNTDSVLSFEYEHEGGLDLLELVLHIRHEPTYPYSNLYLFRQIQMDGVTEHSDTVQITMADAYGNWNGNGVGKLRELDLPYRKGYLRIEEAGTYTFKIQHGMRDANLRGIRSVGLTFIRRNGEENSEEES